MLEQHYDLLNHFMERDRACISMRKFGIKYTALHPLHDTVRQSFVRIKSREEWYAVLDKWYVENLPGCYPDPKIHASTQECGTSS